MDSETLPNLSEDIKMEPTEEKTEDERKREQRIRRLAREAEYRRKARANQTAEERRLAAEKHLWRRRIREGHPSVTEEKLMELKEKYGMNVDKLRKNLPENREMVLKVNAERRRERRKIYKEKNAVKKEKIIKPEKRKKREERLPEEGVKKPRIRKPLSKEKREEKNARDRFRALERRLLMTEEEKEQHKMKQYLRMQAYYAKHGRYYEKSREEKDQQNEKQKVWRDNLTPEGRKRYHDSMRRSQKRRLERYKAADPQYQSKKQAAYWSKVKSEDIGKWRKYRERLNDYQRKKYQAETEEERKKRRYKDKVNGVKRKLRKQLEQEGVEASEMGKRLKEVHERMWKEFDPEWSWEKFGRKAGIQKTEDHSINASGNSLATATNIQAPSSQDKGLINVTVNQKEKEHEAVEISLHSSSTSLHARLPTKPSDPKTNNQLLSVSHDYDSKSCFEHVHDETSLEFDNHNWEPNEMDAFCLSPASPSSPCPDPIENTSFTETPSLYAHDTCSVAEAFKCTFCTLEFFEDSDLRDHMRSFHFDKVWTCPKCNVVVLSPQELSSHFQSVHKASSKPQTPNQVRTTSSNLNFFCMRCCPVKDGIVGFPTRLELFEHVKRKHKREDFWPCDLCSMLKYSQKSLEVHQTICKVSKQSSNVKRGKVKR